MELRPILSTLRRHKTAAGLIVVEIAITAAIVCNAMHLISNRLGLMNQQSGLPESELVVLDVRGGGGDVDGDELATRDLAAMRALPGVRSVTLLNQILYGNNNTYTGVRLEPSDKNGDLSVSDYSGGDQMLATLGLRLVAGRDFLPEEYVLYNAVNQMAEPHIDQVIVSRELAERLWHGQPAVGKVLYALGDTPSTVVGVVERLTAPSPSRAEARDGYSMLFPGRPRGGSYVIRVETGAQDAVIRALPAVIERNDPSRIVESAKPLLEMRAVYYAQDRAMVGLMGGVIAALLVITAFGIIGLASFWVQQRTRMIGIRRALGATRGGILAYFQTENFLLASIGIVLGMAGAYGINQLLMSYYELPRLPAFYLPIGALALWALGQLAVLGPALRAAALPPVVVMRLS